MLPAARTLCQLRHPPHQQLSKYPGPYSRGTSSLSHWRSYCHRSRLSTFLSKSASVRTGRRTCAAEANQAGVTSSDGSSGANDPQTQAQKDRAKAFSTLEDSGSSLGSSLLKPFHLIAFFIILSAGIIFLSVLLYFTADIQFQRAVMKVFRRLLKTVALRQVMGILGAMFFVRYGLEPLVKSLRQVFSAHGPWEKSSEFYILREVYRPLEFLFAIAAFTTLAENFLPQLIALPKGMVQSVVRSTLSLTFVIAAARVVYNVKARITRETIWQLELKGDLTKQRRVETVDKLLSVLTLLAASVFGLQAIGLDVNSVLAIGGVGGLAVGLAGREILENLFTGLIILSSSPFEVGDEVLFSPPTGSTVEGIVIDVGWYRTTIRSFEREVYNIPNSVFSRNVVLNITRKLREWRFYEFIGMRVEDLPIVNAVVTDMRKILRQDPRIIQKLHRRVFLDKITRDQITIYISCYVEATNRDAFMAVKQDLLLEFVDCVERNGGKLARNRLQVEVQPTKFTPVISASTNSATTSNSPSDGGEAGAEGSAAQRALPSGGDAGAGGAAGPSPGGAGAPGSAAGGQQAQAAVNNIVSSAAVTVTAEDISPSTQLGSLITASFDDLPG